MPPITPELIRWIISQAQAGHAPAAVLQAMLASGWSEADAREIIEQCRRGSVIAIPAGGPVPDPDLDSSPNVLCLHDREVQVLMWTRWPRVVVFGQFMSAEECDGLIDLARSRMSQSTTVDSWSGGSELNAVRNSDGTYFELGENTLVTRIENRIAELLRWPVSRGEGLQVLHYGPGGEYRPHYDYFDPTLPGSKSLLRAGGQRVATMLLYLASPLKGGATTFPEIGLSIAPIKGNAVFFSYDRPHPITRSLHGGASVVAGDKWIATKWLREGRQS